MQFECPDLCQESLRDPSWRYVPWSSWASSCRALELRGASGPRSVSHPQKWLAAPPVRNASEPWSKQGLLFGPLKGGFQVSSGTVLLDGIEAVVPSPPRTYYLGAGALKRPLRPYYLGTWMARV